MLQMQRRLEHVRQRFDDELLYIPALWIPQSDWESRPQADPLGHHRPLGFVAPVWINNFLCTPVCPELIVWQTLHLETAEMDRYLEGIWLHCEWHGAFDSDKAPCPTASEAKVMEHHRASHPESLKVIIGVRTLLFGDPGGWSWPQ